MTLQGRIPQNNVYPQSECEPMADNLLTEQAVQKVITQVKAVFPNFADWEYNNETNDAYSGFSLWGQFVLIPEAQMSRHFFITFEIHNEKWRGHLSIGQPCYFWSSADVGDAHLVDPEPCGTLEGAVTALNGEIGDLFRAFSAI
jgi:hypothetical protein